MPANLMEAIWERDVEAVKGYLDVKWDAVRDRRLQIKTTGATKGLIPCGESLWMCVHPAWASSKKKERERSYEIFGVMFSNVLAMQQYQCKDMDYWWTSVLEDFKFFKYDLGTTVGWPKVFQICFECGLSLEGKSTEIVLGVLANVNDLEVLEVVLKSGCPTITMSTLQFCSSRVNFSLEFWRRLLEYAGPEIWSTDGVFEAGVSLIDQMLLKLGYNSNTDLLRLLIEHGLPPTNHIAIVEPILQNVTCSQDFYDILLDHTSPQSKLCWNLSLSWWAHDYTTAMATRPDRIQQLRDHPIKKIRSWSKTMHPGHTLRGDECSLCYDLYKAGQKITKLPCGHVFHLECMLNCVPMKQDTCPYCRTRYI